MSELGPRRQPEAPEIEQAQPELDKASILSKLLKLKICTE